MGTESAHFSVAEKLKTCLTEVKMKTKSNIVFNVGEGKKNPTALRTGCLQVML